MPLAKGCKLSEEENQENTNSKLYILSPSQDYLLLGINVLPTKASMHIKDKDKSISQKAEQGHCDSKFHLSL